MRIGGWQQIGAYRRKFDAPASCRLFSGVSLPPRLRGFICSTTKPTQAPFTDFVAGQGFNARNARTGAGLREMRALKSRMQLMHMGGLRVSGIGNFGAVTIWAFKITPKASASVPIRKQSGCFQGIGAATCTLASVKASAGCGVSYFL